MEVWKLRIITAFLETVFLGQIWAQSPIIKSKEHQPKLGRNLSKRRSRTLVNTLQAGGQAGALGKGHIAPPSYYVTYHLNGSCGSCILSWLCSVPKGVKAPSSTAAAFPPPGLCCFLVQAHPLVELAAHWHLADPIVKLTKLINHERLIGVTRLER